MVRQSQRPSGRSPNGEEATSVTNESMSPDASGPDGATQSTKPTSGSDRSTGSRRWPVVVLSALLVLALAAGVYFLVLARAWSDQATRSEEQARDLGQDLARSRASLDTAEADAASLEDQLDDAQQRVTELADEVAQTGDDREVQRQVAEYEAEISEAARSVANLLQQCIAGQQELISHLEERAEGNETPADDDESEEDEEPPEDEELTELRDEVDGFCQQALEANDELTTQLEQP